MDPQAFKSMLKEALKNELSPLLIGVRNEIEELSKSYREGIASPIAFQFTPEAIKEFKHHDGYTPIKGTDYFTDDEVADFIQKTTPIKGTHYFTDDEVKEFKASVTPQKGVDYDDGAPGYTPIKGKDYFTDAEIRWFISKVTPVKGVDYFDGVTKTVIDYTDISPEEIRNKLESLTGASRLSVKAIKGLTEKIQEHVKNFTAPQSGNSLGGSGSGSSSSTPGATAFTSLTDVPSSYAGQGGKGVRVNAGATGLEFYTISGGGGTPGGSDTQVQFNDGGSTFAGATGITYNKTTQVTTLTAASLTGSSTSAGFNFAQTYNTSGVAEGFKLSYTNTASANTSRWFSIYVGGSEIFSVGRVSYTTSAIRIGNVVYASTSGGQNLLHGGSGGIAFYDAAGSVVWGTISALGAQSWTPSQLTGSSAVSALAITQTWNTTGAPAAISVNITNTASNGNSTFATFQEGGANRFRFIVTTATILFGSGGNATGLGAADKDAGTGNGAGVAFRYLGAAGSGTGYDHWIGGGARSATSGTSGEINTAITFNPTSGTGVFNGWRIAPTINQTGGASGETVGLLIEPTLTAVGGTFHALKITAGKATLAAATTAYPSLTMPAGTAPTTPANGDIWFDGTDIKMRIGGVTKTFTLV